MFSIFKKGNNKNYSEKNLDGNYPDDIGIRCCFCNRQPMEKEEMIILQECSHALCAQCYERLTNFPRDPICPLCLTENIQLDKEQYQECFDM